MSAPVPLRIGNASGFYGDRFDALREMLTDHLAETGSTVAEDLLGDWPPAAARFTKVMPKDYKRVLEAMERARADGVDVDEAVMASVAPPSSSTPFTKKG